MFVCISSASSNVSFLFSVLLLLPVCPLKIYLRFLDYEMANSNECKRNFVAVYDGGR